MRKWLILFVILALALAGTAVWLAGEAEKSKPEAGEVRLEVEGVF